MATTTITKRPKRRGGFKLPMHKASGCYRKCVGKYLGRDGKVRPKIWYFPQHWTAEAVVQEIAKLKTEWRALKVAGKRVWEESIKYHEDEAVSMGGMVRVLTVRTGADLYVAHLKRQCEAGQCKRSHYTSLVYRLARAVAVNIGSDAKPITLAGLPLSIVKSQHIEAAVLKLAGRPDVTHEHHDRDDADDDQPTTHRMSPTYAKACISTLKACLDWLAEEWHWTRCNRWSHVWKARIVLTDDERQHVIEGTGANVDHFTRDELVKLWLACDDTMHADFWKLVILLSLNCGFANEECASLRVSEVKALGTDHPFIERYRGKTIRKAGRGAYAKWYLWPATIQQLLKCKANANADGLWLLSDDGQKLTTHNAIGQGWRRLVKRAGVRGLSYKFLRKTLANIARNELHLPTDQVEMLLSHAEAGQAKAYAARDWDGEGRKATEAVRVYLSPMLTAKRDDDKGTIKLVA